VSRPLRALALAVACSIPTAAVAVPAMASPAAAQEAPSVAAAAQSALDALYARSLASLGSSQWSFVGADAELTVAVDTWVLARKQLAALVADRSSVPAEELDAVWRDTSNERLVATFTALTQVGVPYRRNASSPGRGMDCSGLIMYAWGAAGVALPHQSSGQIRETDLVSKESAEPGDLVWYPGHIMLYLGAGDAVVHAPQTGRRVEVRDASRIRKIGSPLG
jgi:cell wall-associated NlpC family hydrolase